MESRKAVRKYDFSYLRKLVIEDMNKMAQAKGERFKWSHNQYANNVLNGVTYNKDTDTFLMTGKMWPFIFEVKLK